MRYIIKILVVFLSCVCLQAYGANREDLSKLVEDARERFLDQKKRNEILVSNGLGHLANYVVPVTPMTGTEQFAHYFTTSQSFGTQYVNPISPMDPADVVSLNNKLIEINSPENASCVEGVKIYIIVFDALFISTYLDQETAPIFSNSSTAIANPPTVLQDGALPVNLIPSNSASQVSQSYIDEGVFRVTNSTFKNEVMSLIAQIKASIHASNAGDIVITVAGRFYTRLGNQDQPFTMYNFATFDVSGPHLEADEFKESMQADFVSLQSQFEALSSKDAAQNRSLYHSADFMIESIRGLLVKNMGGIAAMCQCLSPNELAHALRSVKEEDCLWMDMDTRFCILKKLCSEAMTADTWYWNLVNAGNPVALINPQAVIGPFQDEEGAALKIMKTVDQDLYVEFLDRMKTEMVTSGSSTKSVFNWLMSRMNGGNYDELVQVMLVMFKSYYNRSSIPFSALQVINYANEESNRCNNGGEHIFNYVELTEVDEIQYAYRVVAYCDITVSEGSSTGIDGGDVTNYNNVYQTNPDQYSGILDAYAPIVLINRSSLPLVGEALSASGNAQVAIVPAFFLKYIDDKDYQATVQKYVQAAAIIVDIATLVTGPGLMIKAFKAGRWLAGIYEASQVVGSGANLTMNVVGVSPELQGFLDKYNLIVAGWGLTRFTTSAVKWSNVLEPVGGGSSIERITVSEAKDFLEKYHQLDIPNNSTLSVAHKTQLKKMKDYLVKEVDEVVDIVYGNYLFKVDDALKYEDELSGVLVNGLYLKNPTARNVNELIKNPSGVMKLDESASSIINGQYMYVVDEMNNIIIGTRASGISPFFGKAPHPTLIGGADPTVKTAGIIEFRAGKIYKVDNVSGHFKPSAQSLEDVQPLFNQKFSPNNFANDFQGFVPFTN